MKCRKCGIEGGDRSFCTNCGSPIGDVHRKFPVWLIVIAAVVVIVVAVVLVFVLNGQDDNNDKDTISAAEKYMEDEEYEKAIDVYDDILDEDDENVAAYLGMAEAYEELGDIEEAAEVLEEGYEKTGSSRIEKVLKRLEKPKQDDTISSAPAATDALVVVGNETEMPDLIGMTWDEAVSKYSSVLDLVAQQEWSTFEKDIIFEQSLPAGRKVKVGKTVTVKVSKGVKQIEIQDLTDLSVDAAERQLKKDGFIVKKTYEESNAVAKDHIIRTEPAANEKADQGSGVTLIISLGADDAMISVPMLTDMHVDEAVERCEEYGLKAEIRTVDSADHAEGLVISQSIAQGELVERNVSIVLDVSSGVAPEKTKKFGFTVPESATGEFEFLFYVDGAIDNERGGEILDIGIDQNKIIPYEISGRVGEVKELVIKPRSAVTGKTGTYIVVSFNFEADEVRYNITEKNTNVFQELGQ